MQSPGKFSLAPKQLRFESTIIPACLALMWAGLFWSRALLSIAMVLFILSSFLSEPMAAKIHRIRTTAYLQLMILLFLIPCVSIGWSADLRYWLKVMQDKLPLLLIPFCAGSLASIPDLARRRLQRFAISVVILSMGMAVTRFLLNAEMVSESYLRAKVMRVDMSSDHIRYAWVLSVILVWTLHGLMEDGSQMKQAARQAGWIFITGIALFLHLLASKTGLLSLYLGLALAAAYYHKRPLVRWMLAAVMAMPLIAWLLIPTFRNRLKFIRWDFQNFSRGGYTEGLSDTPRIRSFDAARDLIESGPWFGTGFGDLRASMSAWYQQNASFMKPYEYLLPSNEAVLHAAAAGIPMAIIFVFATVSPFFLPSHRRSYANMAFHAIAFAGFQYEIGLETQYGVFIFAVMGCWGLLMFSKPRGSLPSPG